MIINTAVTFALFLVVLVGGTIITWPDVPWTPLLVTTIVITGLTPVVFYARSKLVWQAIELSYHPLEEREIAETRDTARGV